MPLLKDDPSLLAGYDPHSPIVLPALFGPVWGGAGEVEGWAASTWADANYQQWSRLTKSVVSGVAMKVGVPGWNVAGFGTFFANVGDVTASQVASVVLGNVARIVDLALRESATAIPILGWAVELGLLLYDGINLAIQSNKEAKKKNKRPPGEALTFSSDMNEEIATQIAGLARDMDFQHAFLPPSTSGAWSLSGVYYGGGHAGYAFGTRNDLGRGLIPGLAQCVGTLTPPSANVNYQFREWDPNYGLSFGAAYHVSPLETAGSLAPSSEQLSVLLWQQVMKTSVPQFYIDPYALVSTWHDYYMGLAEFAETLKTEQGVKNASKKVGKMRIPDFGSNPKLPYNEAKIATTYLPFSSQADGSIIFASPEYSNWDTSAQIAVAPRGVSIDTLVAVIGSDLTYTYADFVKYVCKLHIERSLASLSTLICAYVPEDAPLLRASGAHKKRWEDMRRLLLRNRAVHKVEVELIPPGDPYRNAVVQAQRANAGLGFTIGGTQSAPVHPPSPGEAPTVDGGPPPWMPPSPAPGMPPRLPRPRLSRTTSPPLASRIMFGASLACAAAAGGVVLYDRYGRAFMKARR